MLAIRRGKRLAALMVTGMFFVSPLAAVADDGTPAPEPPAATAPASDSNQVPDPGFETLDGGDTGQGNVPLIITYDDGASKKDHERVKREIKQMVDKLPDKVPLESAGDTDKEGIGKAPSKPKTYKPKFEDQGDIYQTTDASFIKGPARIARDIEKIPGVKGVFRDRVYYPTRDADPNLDNAVPLDMMGAASVNATGEGQVVAVIDTALKTNHEAFSGRLDSTKVKWTSAKISSIKSKLAHGRSGRYITEKIPFTYDYADGDSEVNTYQTEMDHGTHVAGIAVANSGRIRGTAPDAQLVFMKVGRDRDRALPTSAILKALEDCYILRVDAVNMSLGLDAGASEAEQTAFGEVYAKLRGTGITLSVAASNAFSAAYKNKSGRDLPYTSDPDSSTVGDPATFTESVAVASVETEGQRAGSAARTPDRRLTMSGFSSWGVRPDGILKPEITAPGGGIISAINNGGYGKMSGTSMAAPQIAGVAAQMHQYLKGAAGFSRLSDSERGQRVTQLLMGTSTPIKDTTDPNSYISPRKQGSGLTNVPAAMKTTVYPTVTGAKDASRPKADLGDGTRGWQFEVKLTNVGNQAVTYRTESVALSEKVSNGFFQEHSKNWTGQGINVSHSKNTVTVPANGSTTVKVKVAIGQQFYDFARQLPNGTFVDGFTFFRGQNDAPDLSIPFCGFYGDWGTIPVFDADIYSGGNAHMYASSLVDFSSERPLGQGQARKTYAQYIMPMTGTLRTVDKLTYTYRNQAGQVVKQYEYEHAPKSLYVPGRRKVFNVESNIGQPVFTGTDNRYNRLDDGQYTLTIEADVAGSNKNQQLIYTFYYGRSSGSYVINVRHVRDAAGNAAPPDNSPVQPDPDDPTAPANPTPTQPANPRPTPSDPANPSDPDEPTRPGDPSQPDDPARPGDPSQPDNPTRPGDPSRPSDPTPGPGDPSEPADPLPTPSDPSRPSDPDEPAPGNPGKTPKPGDPTNPDQPDRPIEDPSPVPNPPTQEPVPDPSQPSKPGKPGTKKKGTDTISIRRGTKLYVKNRLSSSEYAQEVYSMFRTGDIVYAGDWDGDGKTTVAIRRGSTVSIINDMKSAKVAATYKIGNDGDELIVGDWNGDGRDSFAVRQGEVFLIIEDLSSGKATRKVTVTGSNGLQVVAGDWDGDGIDTLAFRKGDRATLLLKRGSSETRVVNLPTGVTGETTLLAGDWNGDGIDTFCLRKGGWYYLSNTLGGTRIDQVAYIGSKNDEALVGNWDGK